VCGNLAAGAAHRSLPIIARGCDIAFMASDPSHDRDPLGRIMPDPKSPHPFAKWKAPRNRDGRSDRPVKPRRDGEPTISFRVPERVYRAIRLTAARRGSTVTALVQEALVPVLQAPEWLHENVPPAPRSFGPNRKVPRLEDKIKSPVTNPVPAFDRMGRWQQRQEEKTGFKGNLVDRPRR